MRDPAKVELPSAASLPRDDLLLLHAVLLHGGALPPVLAAAVATDQASTRVVLGVLEAQDLVVVDDAGRVRVAPAALPSVWIRLEFAGAVAAGAISWLFPRLAEAFPARFRTRVLTLVPALRLTLGLVVVVWAVPKVIAPTPQKPIAVLGAVGIALGFAFRP